MMPPDSWNTPPVNSTYPPYSAQPTADPGPSARWIYPPGSVGSYVPPSAGGSANPYALSYEPLPQSQPGEESPDGARTYKCRWCERYFAHESSKCRHEKEHFNQFPCPEPGCDVVSTRKDSLKRHLRLMHGTSEGSSSQASSSRYEGGGTSGRLPRLSLFRALSLSLFFKALREGESDAIRTHPIQA